MLRHSKEESLHASRQIVCQRRNNSSRSGEERFGLEAIEEWSCANARRNSGFEGTPIRVSSASTSDTRLCNPSNTTLSEKAENVCCCNSPLPASGRNKLEIIFRNEIWL